MRDSSSDFEHAGKTGESRDESSSRYWKEERESVRIEESTEIDN